MKKKIERIAEIRRIIEHNSVGSQDELLQLLLRKNYDVTQATLSRDLKQMQVAKVAMRDGGYVYVMPDMAESMRNSLTSSRFVQPHSMLGVKNIECSNILVVIKTKPAYASIIASHIDGAEIKEVMGTIAGDDTVVVIPRGGYTTNQVAEALCNILPKQ